MITSYFKIAWRNSMKNKLFSSLNIFGLALGMTVCMLALVKVKGAYDYDTFHPFGQRIFRIVTELEQRSTSTKKLLASTPGPLNDYLREDYQGIEKTARVFFVASEAYTDVTLQNINGAFVDPEFFEMFGFKLRSGYAPIEPQTIVLTEATAKRFFGNDDPIGKTITFKSNGEFVVTGIVEKPPFPSHLRFDYLSSMSAMALLEKQATRLANWQDEYSTYTYVMLKEGLKESDLNVLLESVSETVNRSLLADPEKVYRFQAQSLNEISPAIRPIYNTTSEPSLPNLVGFVFLGAVMLLLALFNYVNMTLARSIDRAKEVGIRKVIGAHKHHVTFQFLTESVLIAFLSLMLGEVMLESMAISLPVVSGFIFDIPQDWTLVGYYLIFTLFTGVLAGWIPAKILSRLQPVNVLKGKFDINFFGKTGLRKILIVTQFAASLVAIVTVIVFYNQSVFMATSDYGFSKERILNVDIDPNDFEKLHNVVSQYAGVEEVSATSKLFGFSDGQKVMLSRRGLSDSVVASAFSATPSLLSTMGMNIVSGTVNTGHRSIIINEIAARQMEFKSPVDAIGQHVRIKQSEYMVAGVVKDFHYAGYLTPIRPMILMYNPEAFSIMNVKIVAGSEQNVQEALARDWKKLMPGQPLRATWYEQELYDLHINSEDLAFVGTLAGMALSIAALGLVGIVLFSVKNRSKEVSLRKTMGANAWEIMVLISRDFLLLIFAAIVIGMPLGFYAGTEFLQQYAYRVPVGVGVLSASAAILLAVGGLIIGAQTWRAANRDPIESLRAE